MPSDAEAHKHHLCSDTAPCQVHNNCSGKHVGFLTLNQKLGAGTEYVEVDHPVQIAVRDAFEDVTDGTSPGYGIDGCSAPNFATTVHGLARGVAQFAKPGGGVRGQAQQRLVSAMMAYPELGAGEGKACTDLMRAGKGSFAIKTGAEGVYIGIVPGQGLGFALKVQDGTTRAAECATAALLVRLGLLDADHPTVRRFVNAPILNRRDINTGIMRPVGLI